MNRIVEKISLLSVAIVALLMVCTLATGQEEEVKQQEQRTASIERMQKRIAEIEEQVKSASLERAQELGEEAFGLFGEIDQTFLQMKDNYQQQVSLLNDRMRQMWENVENSDGETRESIDKKLEMLQTDWDRVFNHLTQTHDSHLQQLKESLVKLRGEFSKSASRAQAELETSHFDAMVRWEQAHEIFLKISQTFTKAVGDQLASAKARIRDNPDVKEFAERLDRVRTRYWSNQNRLQQRYLSHLDHLREELALRQLQHSVTTARDEKQKIRSQLEHLNNRTQTTYDDLQTSFGETVATLETAVNDLTAKLKTAAGTEREKLEEQVAALASQLSVTKKSLVASYQSRLEFTQSQVDELGKWISDADEEAGKRYEAKLESLRALANRLSKQTNGNSN